jgi:hypothetical protein
VSKKQKTSKRKSALRAECDRVDRERIRERLDLPIEKRMNFLRVRIPGGGSYL